VRESWTRDERFRPFLADDGQSGSSDQWTCGATMSLPERADYSLTESALAPFQAEPHFKQDKVLSKLDPLGFFACIRRQNLVVRAISPFEHVTTAHARHGIDSDYDISRSSHRPRLRVRV